MFEGLTVVAVGMVGDELRLCYAVPRAYTRGERGRVVVVMDSACYEVEVC